MSGFWTQTEAGHTVHVNGDPIWTDAKIKALTVLAANTVDPQARWMHEQVAKDMRDDYERALAFRNEDIGRLQGEVKTQAGRIAELETQLQQAQTSAADYMILLSANADLKAENERLTELLRGDRMVVATRINHELTTARRRNIELEAAINGCAGQWTPMPEGAHYCGCSEEDCPGEWRIENNGSRLVIGDGESELSVEFYEAIRVCWQVQPSINA